MLRENSDQHNLKKIPAGCFHVPSSKSVNYSQNCFSLPLAKTLMPVPIISSKPCQNIRKNSPFAPLHWVSLPCPAYKRSYPACWSVETRRAVRYTRSPTPGGVSRCCTCWSVIVAVINYGERINPSAPSGSSRLVSTNLSIWFSTNLFGCCRNRHGRNYRVHYFRLQLLLLWCWRLLGSGGMLLLRWLLL